MFVLVYAYKQRMSQNHSGQVAKFNTLDTWFEQTNNRKQCLSERRC